MAAVTLGVTSVDTNNTNSYATGAFTPAANDLLVAFVAAPATVATGTMTDSQSLGFTKVTSALGNSSADTGYLFVANALAAASSMTVTFDCTGDNATGAAINVFLVSGMTRVGTSAVLQTAKAENQGAGGTPAATFGASCLTGNPTIGMVANAANPAALTFPTNWIERDDTGFANPTRGMETVSRDSGFTGTTITWGGTSATAFLVLIAELDTSVAQSVVPVLMRQYRERRS